MPAILMTWLLIAVIHHTALGLQVGIGGQKRAVTKLAELIIIPPSCLALAVAGIVATLRIVFRGYDHWQGTRRPSDVRRGNVGGGARKASNGRR